MGCRPRGSFDFDRATGCPRACGEGARGRPTLAVSEAAEVGGHELGARYDVVVRAVWGDGRAGGVACRRGVPAGALAYGGGGGGLPDRRGVFDLGEGERHDPATRPSLREGAAAGALAPAAVALVGG